LFMLSDHAMLPLSMNVPTISNALNLAFCADSNYANWLMSG